MPLDTLDPDEDAIGGRNLQPIDVLLIPTFNAARQEYSKDQVSFKVRLQEQFNEYCTPRPLLVLGHLSSKSGGRNLDFLISDFGMDRSHYPVIQLPAHPWMRDKSKKPVQANLTLWMAFEDIAFKNTITLKDGDEKKVGNAVLTRNQRKVTVTLTSVDSKRLFVVCDKAARSERVFDRPNRTETHDLKLFPSTDGQDVSIKLIEPDELNVKKMHKLEFDVSPDLNLP